MRWTIEFLIMQNCRETTGYMNMCYVLCVWKMKTNSYSYWILDKRWINMMFKSIPHMQLEALFQVWLCQHDEFKKIIIRPVNLIFNPSFCFFHSFYLERFRIKTHILLLYIYNVVVMVWFAFTSNHNIHNPHTHLWDVFKMEQFIFECMGIRHQTSVMENCIGNNILYSVTSDLFLYDSSYALCMATLILIFEHVYNVHFSLNHGSYSEDSNRFNIEDLLINQKYDIEL